MTLKFRCQHCFRKIAAEEEDKGQKLNCPSCNRVLQVPSPRFGAGKDIGGFVIEQWLGNGAMGEVHLARQTAMGRMVALKIMTKDKMVEEDDKQRFIREVQTLAKLNHPNIVAAISAGDFEDGAYLAMNYITGSTAEDKVNKNGPLSEKEALNCCLSVAEALKYAWNNGKVLHRDIKPANIMIDENNMVHLMDMGIAKSMDGENQITMAGMVMGTPYYMSPEQAQAITNLDQRSDIYSLGATLYHMVTGVQPFYGKTALQIMAQKLKEAPKDPQEINPELSDKISKLIKKFMAIDINKRPANWDEAIELFKEALAPPPKKAVKKLQLSSTNANNNTPVIRKSSGGGSSTIIVIVVIIAILGGIIFAMTR